MPGTAALNGLLGLPPAARIISVNGRGVKTLEETSRMVRDELLLGNIPRLSVSGAGGVQEVYLTGASSTPPVDTGLPPWERTEKLTSESTSDQQ